MIGNQLHQVIHINSNINSVIIRTVDALVNGYKYNSNNEVAILSHEEWLPDRNTQIIRTGSLF